jgi:hypothetical protein
MGDDRMIPGLSVYCLKASDFEVSIRPALDQGGNALFGEDEKQVRVGQKEHLPIAISIRPPVAFAGFRVEADEGAAVEAVNVPFVEDPSVKTVEPKAGEEGRCHQGQLEHDAT